MHRVILLVVTKIKSIFHRSISFSSQVEYSTISGKARVWGHCKVFHSAIGDYSYLGVNSRLIYTHVGKFCSIGGNCAIGMGSHSIKNISTSPIFTAKKNALGISWSHDNKYEEYKVVEIGNDVWIGQRVMIIGGVHIGNGAVIGAGAIVTKDIPPYAVAVGVPAKVIRYRFPQEQIDALLAHPWWNLPEEQLRERIELFQSGDKIEEKINALCYAKI